METVSRADVVVVGGGIVGGATAYYLARRGARVVLVEKGRVAGEQSGRAWGFVRRQGRPLAAMALMAPASRTWDGLSAELDADIEYVRSGHLAVAETAADVARLEEGARAAREGDVDSRLITAAEVRALVPEMQGTWRAGLHSAQDGHAEPLAVTAAFAAAARRLGVEVREGCTALGLETRGDRVCALHTDGGRVEAPHVVAAAGVWTARLVASAGVELPLRIVRSSVGATRPAPPLTRLGVWGPLVAFRQRASGHVYLGNGYRGVSADHDLTLASLRHLRLFLPAYRENWRLLRLRLGRDLLSDIASRLHRNPQRRFASGPWTRARVDEAAVRAAEQAFGQLFPRAAGLGLERTWAGYIELTPDHLPVLGEVDRPRGLHLAVGASHGFSMGPVIGQRLAASILDDRPALDLRPFRLSRFREGPIERPRKAF